MKKKEKEEKENGKRKERNNNRNKSIKTYHGMSILQISDRKSVKEKERKSMKEIGTKKKFLSISYTQT